MNPSMLKGVALIAFSIGGVRFFLYGTGSMEALILFGLGVMALLAFYCVDYAYTHWLEKKARRMAAIVYPTRTEKKNEGGKQ